MKLKKIYERQLLSYSNKGERSYSEPTLMREDKNYQVIRLDAFALHCMHQLFLFDFFHSRHLRIKKAANIKCNTENNLQLISYVQYKSTVE